MYIYSIYVGGNMVHQLTGNSSKVVKDWIKAGCGVLVSINKITPTVSNYVVRTPQGGLVGYVVQRSELHSVSYR